MAAAARIRGLLPELMRRRDELLPRFAAYYTQLRALPRRVRRALQRQWHLPLAGVALMLALGQSPGTGGHDSGRGLLYSGGRHHGGQHRHRDGRVSGRQWGRHDRAAGGQHTDPDQRQQQHLWTHGAAGDQQRDDDCRAGEHDYAGEWSAGVSSVGGEQHGGPDAAGDHGEWGEQLLLPGSGGGVANLAAPSP